ncbi:uncharacterized protein CBL_06973 [Carabus blaptoides fortunei]
MCDKLEEVRKDIAELEQLQVQATRQRVKDILSIDIRRLVSDAVKLEDQAKVSSNLASPTENKNTAAGNKCYQVKLNNYAWDQSQKFLKLYVTLAKVHTLPAENVVCNWTNKNLEMQANGLENKNYIFNIKNLLEDIDPSRSSWKVKTDMVVISAAKLKEGNWSHVTEFDKKASDSKKLLPDKETEEEAGPEASLINMMKKMYEQGDDEMKRTIAKAWHEGQNKRSEL